VRRELSRRHPNSLLYWSLANREFGGRPMRLPPMLRALYVDDHPFLVVQKSAQVGASEYLINCALWAADTGQGGRGNVLYVMPAQAQAIDFASARINKAVLESPALLERVRPRPAAVSSAARTTTRRVGKGHLYVRGAESRRQLITVDADLLIIDELDTMGEGTLEVTRRRLGSSRLGWIRLASTPSIPNAGINAWFLRGDQRRWYIPCPACPVWQTLVWQDNVDQERAVIVCAECGEPLDTQSAGFWMAARPEVTDIHSYHVSRLYSPYLDLPQLIAASRATDPIGVREFFNSDLGEPYAGEGDRLTFAILDACCCPYRPEPKARSACMGVDVGSQLHVVVRSPDPNDPSSSRLLFAATLPSFDDLDNLMTVYGVHTCVIDAHPETHAARTFASRWPGKVWLCRYQSRTTGPAWDSATCEVVVDRTMSLDELFEGFREQRLTLPENARGLGGEVRDNAGTYYRHLCALTRTVAQDASGNTVHRYLAPGPDHFAHAENYCCLALTRLPRSQGPAIIAVHGPGRLSGLGGRSNLSAIFGRYSW
jgi:hypothetical protein